MMRMHIVTFLAVSLAIMVGGTAPGISQTYRMVSNRGTNPGELRVWNVTIDGQMDVIDLIETDEVGFTHTLYVDPFGRFLIYSNAVDSVTALDTYAISPSGEVSFAHRYTRPTWQLDDDDHVLTPDGHYFCVSVCDDPASSWTWYLEALKINDNLALTETGYRLEVYPDGPPNVSTPDRMGSCLLPDGNYVLVTTFRTYNGYVNILPMTASGEIIGLAQQFVYPHVQAINGGVATRLDQRLAAVGPMGTDRLTSYAVSPEGYLTPLNSYSSLDFGGLSPLYVSFHPSGLSLLAGGVPSSIPVSASGEFFHAAYTEEGSGSELAVSPDGRIGVSTWDADAQGIHWGVFRLDPYGGIERIADHVFPFGYADIAFIPPRTEEVLGDANGDAMRDAADLVTYLNHINDPGIYPEWHPLSPRIRGPIPEARADADQDGDIDEDDLAWLLEFLLGDSD